MDLNNCANHVTNEYEYEMLKDSKSINSTVVYLH